MVGWYRRSKNKLVKFHTTKPIIKSLNVRKRWLAKTALETVQIRILNDQKRSIYAILKKLIDIHGFNEDILVEFFKILVKLNMCIARIEKVDERINQRPGKIESKHRTIDSFKDEDIPNIFRFRNKAQLKALFDGLGFPLLFKGKKGHKYSGEEVLLLGLFRLANPIPSTHATYVAIFGYAHDKVSKVFNVFLNFMCDEWGYLLTDMIEYWKPSIPMFADKIRLKLDQLGCPFPSSSNSNGGFNIFGFIDNTMNAMCRPGGGPTRDGDNAPRNNPLIQRAFYNGWKKVHGLKYQTVDLPNGMNFHVYGPVSLRHNDNYTLVASNINDKIANLFMNDELQFMIYGDSAYEWDSHLRSRYGSHSSEFDFDENVAITNDKLSARQKLENKCLSSCREIIEWDYGECMKMWKMCDYRKVLKLRKMPVSNMFKCVMILRNLHVTMNGCNASSYFTCMPPSYEHYTSKRKKSMHNII
jgi:hypothetical protein